MKLGKFRWLWRIFLIGLLLVLLVWAVKEISFQETWNIISQLQAWQILALVALDCFIILLFSSRWWILLRAYNQKIHFLNIVGYRQAAFSISYFTPGTQFGGEPFQVHLVQSRQGVSMPTAVASVTLDKLFELAGNFAFLAAGALVVIVYGLFDRLPRLPIALAAAGMLLLPTLYLLAVAKDRQPATRLVTWAACRWPHSTSVVRIQSTVTSSEIEMQCILREHPSLVLIIAILSGLTWGAVLAEYWLMVAFLGERLSLLQTVAGLTAARASFLIPLPGGIGALEGSQIFAMQAIGLEASLGLSIGLLIRARDLFFGLVGLVLLWFYTRSSSGKIPKQDVSTFHD